MWSPLPLRHIMRPREVGMFVLFIIVKILFSNIHEKSHLTLVLHATFLWCQLPIIYCLKLYQYTYYKLTNFEAEL